MPQATLRQMTGVPASRPVEAAAFRAAMRHLAGAVCIITTGAPPERAGLTATAVCSVTADPPRVLVCVNRSASSHDVIVRNRRLGINALSAAHLCLARRFAGMVAGVHGDSRFAEGSWSMVGGVPLLDDACMAMACTVEEVIPASTHSIFMCEVVWAQSVAADSLGSECLIYFDGHFRQLAPLARNEPPIEWIW